MFSVFQLTCNFIFEQTEGRMMGGECTHIVETRMFCTVCLKSSCLLIRFHSWSLDLSQTLIQTLQILKEEKAGPKPWQNQKTKKKQKVSPHVTCPASPQTLSTGRNFLLCLFFVFSKFLPLCQSNNVSCYFFLCFLFSCFLGSWEKFSP